MKVKKGENIQFVHCGSGNCSQELGLQGLINQDKVTDYKIKSKLYQEIYREVHKSVASKLNCTAESEIQ